MHLTLIHKNKFIIIFLAILLIGVVTYFILTGTNNNYDKEPRIVKNFNDFYTVSNCISDFVNYANNDNSEALISLLSHRYKESQSLNTSNVLEKFDYNDEIFKAKKMFFKHIGENENVYYVYGLQGQEKEGLVLNYDESNLNKVYYTVYIDDEKKAFSIEPIKESDASSLGVFKE